MTSEAPYTPIRADRLLDIPYLVESRPARSVSIFGKPSAEPAFLVYGTLIVAIPCAEGIVICADRKMSHELLRSGDLPVLPPEQKILPIGKPSGTRLRQFAVAGATGLAGVYDARDGAVTSIVDLIADFFRRVDSRSIRGPWDKPVLHVLKRLGPGFLKKARNEKRGTRLFTIPIFWVGYDGFKSIRIEVLVGDSGIEVNPEPIGSAAFAVAAPIAFGDVWALRELLSGKDPRFDEFRNLPELKPYLTGPTSPTHKIASETSLEEANIAARTFIGVSNAMYETRGVVNAFGLQVNVGVLHRRDGFRFLV